MDDKKAINPLVNGGVTDAMVTRLGLRKMTIFGAVSSEQCKLLPGATRPQEKKLAWTMLKN
jgi:hypothetical protein